MSPSFSETTPRGIHKKVRVDDPNLLQLSDRVRQGVSLSSVLIDIASAYPSQIEQWSEHHYPGFLQITSNDAGKPVTGLDGNSTDARVKLFKMIADREREKAAAARREQIMADLRARGNHQGADAGGEGYRGQEAGGGAEIGRRGRPLVDDWRDNLGVDHGHGRAGGAHHLGRDQVRSGVM